MRNSRRRLENDSGSKYYDSWTIIPMHRITLNMISIIRGCYRSIQGVYVTPSSSLHGKKLPPLLNERYKFLWVKWGKIRGRKRGPRIWDRENKTIAFFDMDSSKVRFEVDMEGETFWGYTWQRRKQRSVIRNRSDWNRAWSSWEHVVSFGCTTGACEVWVRLLFRRNNVIYVIFSFQEGMDCLYYAVV